jgi:hypothetical protein
MRENPTVEMLRRWGSASRDAPSMCVVSGCVCETHSCNPPLDSPNPLRNPLPRISAPDSDYAILGGRGGFLPIPVNPLSATPASILPLQIIFPNPDFASSLFPLACDRDPLVLGRWAREGLLQRRVSIARRCVRACVRAVDARMERNGCGEKPQWARICACLWVLLWVCLWVCGKA